MIETYQKDGLILEAVKLEDTMGSIIECTHFVVGSRHDYRVTDTNTGLTIKFPERGLYAFYGNYIAKDVQGEVVVISGDAFEAEYTKLPTEDPITQSEEKTIKWDEVGARKYT